jgi:hypothetical protein
MVEFSFGIGVVGSGMVIKLHAKAIQVIEAAVLVATYSRRDRAATNFITHDPGAAHARVGKFLTHDGRDIVHHVHSQRRGTWALDSGGTRILKILRELNANDYDNPLSIEP